MASRGTAGAGPAGPGLGSRSRATAVGPPRGPRFGFGFVLLALGVLAVISAVTGAHFFWPAIPLIFLGLFLVRGACLGPVRLRPPPPLNPRATTTSLIKGRLR